MIEVTTETRERVRTAMEEAPRAAFLPDSVRHLADADRPVLIGWDATNSQPSTVARMLELLDVRAGDRVLDVGSGSAWTTAILARLTGASGTVVGVERVPELVEYGRERLRESGVEAAVEHAVAGVLGLPERAPFDRILVSADFGSMPQTLIEQLADPGRLVAPVSGVMTVVDFEDGHTSVRHDTGLYSFVPLIE